MKSLRITLPGLIALVSFLNFTTLPWVIYARGEAIWLDLGAAGFWFVTGAVSGMLHLSTLHNQKNDGVHQ